MQRVLQQGYHVTLRLRTLPLDVKIKIVKHSNRHYDGNETTVHEMIAGVAEFQQAFASSLSAKHVNSKTCAQKCDYTHYGMYAKYAKENHAEMFGRKWETFDVAKVIFHQGFAVGFVGKDCHHYVVCRRSRLVPVSRLSLQAALWAEVFLADTQRTEVLNGQVFSAARFAQNMQLPLMSARLTGKHHHQPRPAADQKTPLLAALWII